MFVARAQVSVTAGEVKGAIVHINSLFIISMVKSRLTQRLTRARKNIARRRMQATTSGSYGPSLSDTEQVRARARGGRAHVPVFGLSRAACVVAPACRPAGRPCVCRSALGLSVDEGGWRAGDPSTHRCLTH